MILILMINNTPKLKSLIYKNLDHSNNTPISVSYEAAGVFISTD